MAKSVKVKLNCDQCDLFRDTGAFAGCRKGKWKGGVVPSHRTDLVTEGKQSATACPEHPVRQRQRRQRQQSGG